MSPPDVLLYLGSSSTWSRYELVICMPFFLPLSTLKSTCFILTCKSFFLRAIRVLKSLWLNSLHVDENKGKIGPKKEREWETDRKEKKFHHKVKRLQFPNWYHFFLKLNVASMFDWSLRGLTVKRTLYFAEINARYFNI